MPFSQDPRKGYNVFMAKENINRSGCKDVFHAFLVKNASYDGNLEMPCIKAEDAVPQNVITFSKAVRSKEYDNFVHFYEDDVNFERIWNNPNRYLPILKSLMGLSVLISVYTVICHLLCNSGTHIVVEQLAIGCRQTVLRLFLISDLQMNDHLHFAATESAGKVQLLLVHMDV